VTAPAPFVRPDWADTEDYHPRQTANGTRVESDVFWHSRDLSTVDHVSVSITRSDTENDEDGLEEGSLCIKLTEDPASPEYPYERVQVDIDGDPSDTRTPAVRARSVAAALLDAADEYDRITAEANG
jgi:hypothetical protein